SLKKELSQKNEELEALKKYETEYKVRITKGYLNSFIDIVHQFPEIRIPNGGTRLLSASTESVWVKMICKYFQHGEEEINIETLRSRFTSDKENPSSKFRPISEKDRIFKIEPVESA